MSGRHFFCSLEARPSLPPLRQPRLSPSGHAVWCCLTHDLCRFVAAIPPRDAAALACVCANTAAAYRESRWPRSVRIKLSGAVLEPAPGTFDVTVAPGEGVQAAVDRCPRGGCVLLLPGTHAGPLVLAAGKRVHVFGRGQATLRTTAGDVLTSRAFRATFDGVSFKRVLVAAAEYEHCVVVRRGALRLQTCDITSMAGYGIYASPRGGARVDLSVVECKCVERILSSCPGGGDDAPGLRVLSMHELP